MKFRYLLIFLAIYFVFNSIAAAQDVEFQWVYESGYEGDRGSLVIDQSAFESRSVSTEDVKNFYFDNAFFGIFETNDLEFIEASNGSELVSGSSRHSAGPSIWGYMLYLDFQFSDGVGGDQYQATGFGTDGLRSWAGSGSWQLFEQR